MIYTEIYAAVPVLEEIEFTFIMYRERLFRVLLARRIAGSRVYITIAVQLRGALYIPHIVLLYRGCHRRRHRRSLL